MLFNYFIFFIIFYVLAFQDIHYPKLLAEIHPKLSFLCCYCDVFIVSCFVNSIVWHAPGDSPFTPAWRFIFSKIISSVYRKPGYRAIQYRYIYKISLSSFFPSEAIIIANTAFIAPPPISAIWTLGTTGGPSSSPVKSSIPLKAI